MLTIHTKLIDAMLDQAHKDHPMETCGIIVGPKGGNQPLRLIPMRNAAQSSTFFTFDPQQQLQTWREMETRNEVPVVIYHSHTESQAYPSRSDIEFAHEPQCHYVIIATDSNYSDKIRSFRIINSSVTEERIHIVKHYPHQEESTVLAV